LIEARRLSSTPSGALRPPTSSANISPALFCRAVIRRMMSRGAGSQSPDEEKASELPFWRNCGRREFFERCRRLLRQCTGQRLETDAVPCRAGHKLRAGPQPSLLRAWSFARVRPLSLAERDFLVAIVSMSLSRWLPQKSFPPYAYLPGRNPHPVRDPTGHSYHVGPLPVATEASLGSDAFLWGLDLFNHGYYWEAHEAWEGLWQVADRDNPLRMLFKSLILLSAAGVKVRERKNAAAARHAVRAAALLRELLKVQDSTIERALGMSPATLAEHAEAATGIPAELRATAPGQPQSVFNFILGPILT
jgi:hypothetical protein